MPSQRRVTMGGTPNQNRKREVGGVTMGSSRRSSITPNPKSDLAAFQRTSNRSPSVSDVSKRKSIGSKSVDASLYREIQDENAKLKKEIERKKKESENLKKEKDVLLKKIRNIEQEKSNLQEDNKMNQE